MVPSLDTAPPFGTALPVDDENGLAALVTCGSLAMLAVAWLTALWRWLVVTVPLRRVEDDLPAVAAF